ncbi:MAG: hypothetical protein RMZ41_031735 [Nostoc sp. DedVER02]|nr:MULTISPECIES: hypothetical protein [unclassified Nostoc]MDZ7984377.1 hypothetical protein [Nostoc sp. DedVER02]
MKYAVVFVPKLLYLQIFVERSQDISHDLHLYQNHLIEKAGYN